MSKPDAGDLQEAGWFCLRGNASNVDGATANLFLKLRCPRPLADLALKFAGGASWAQIKLRTGMSVCLMKASCQAYAGRLGWRLWSSGIPAGVSQAQSCACLGE